ncbi:hypothetical protein AeNC1_011897, partial [Aphanomyces euteiches]
NLSHNTLQSNWIQTPLPMTTLDVSYNQGGLPWIQNVKRGVSLPKLTRLLYRGNNLTNLKWDEYNFPAGQHPFAAMDLSGNPHLTIRMEMITFVFMKNRFNLTADATSYNATLRICENFNEYIVQFDAFPVEYSPQGDAQYNKAVAPQPVYVCSWGYYDPTRTSMPASKNDAKTGTVLLTILYIALVILVLYLWCRFARTCFNKCRRCNDDNTSMESKFPFVVQALLPWNISGRIQDLWKIDAFLHS